MRSSCLACHKQKQDICTSFPQSGAFQFSSISWQSTKSYRWDTAFHEILVQGNPGICLASQTGIFNILYIYIYGISFISAERLVCQVQIAPRFQVRNMFEVLQSIVLPQHLRRHQIYRPRHGSHAFTQLKTASWDHQGFIEESYKVYHIPTAMGYWPLGSHYYQVNWIWICNFKHVTPMLIG